MAIFFLAGLTCFRLLFSSPETGISTVLAGRTALLEKKIQATGQELSLLANTAEPAPDLLETDKDYTFDTRSASLTDAVGMIFSKKTMDRFSAAIAPPIGASGASDRMLSLAARKERN